MLNKAKIAVGVATIGMAMAVIPALSGSASAAVARTSTVRSIETSALCKAYKSEEQAAVKTESGSAIEKAIESGNYATVKKDLLASFGGEQKEEQVMLGFLNGAPSKVKAAAQESIKFDNSLKSIISNSNSMAQFEAGITTAEKNKKLQAAEVTLSDFTNKECGAPPTTSLP